MSPATQDQPEPPPSTQTSVAHVDKADVVASEILAEKPAVEKKKEKKDKKEKREKKRKSAVIDDEAVRGIRIYEIYSVTDTILIRLGCTRLP